MGYDIYLGRQLSFSQITSCLPNVLRIPEDKFLLIQGSLFDYVDSNGDLTIDYKDDDPRQLVEVNYESGEFPTKLEIHIAESDCKLSELSFAKNVSILEKVKSIISSDEINPYHWTLIEPDGSHRNVFVDREALDKENAFVVVGDADY